MQSLSDLVPIHTETCATATNPAYLLHLTHLKPMPHLIELILHLW